MQVAKNKENDGGRISARNRKMEAKEGGELGTEGEEERVRLRLALERGEEVRSGQ